MGRSARIGVTGTLGSGKSTVARMMEQWGARVIDADQIAREVVAPGCEALAQIAGAFGKDMIRPDGSLDRARLAERVFPDPAALERLNAIVHPRVRRRELELIAQYESEGDSPIVLDVPLLYENGLDALADRVVVVAIDDETRSRRLQKSRSMTREQIEARLAAQASQSEKRLKAHYVIDNSGTVEQTRRQARKVMDEIELLKE